MFAAHDVIDRLKDKNVGFQGEAVAIAGNLPALAESTRYIDVDLNRIWSGERIYKLRKGIGDGEKDISELTEQNEIFGTIRELCLGSSGPVFMIDLHTTSAESIPFIFISDTMRNRHFVQGIPVPVILGVEEILDSTLLNFANHIGIVCFGFEAGSHYLEMSYNNMVSAIWVTLVKAGCLKRSETVEYGIHYSNLKESAGGTTDYFQLIFRYGISENEKFVMEPGFVNFEGIRKGQHLATSDSKKVLSPENGKILMPLYQSQGNDGFYIIKRLNGLWIRVSAVLRKINLNRVIMYIPGIYNLKARRNVFAIKRTRISDPIINLMHLAGYHQTRRILNQVLLSRREFDLSPPSDYGRFFR